MDKKYLSEYTRVRNNAAFKIWLVDLAEIEEMSVLKLANLYRTLVEHTFKEGFTLERLRELLNQSVVD